MCVPISACGWGRLTRTVLSSNVIDLRRNRAVLDRLRDVYPDEFGALVGVFQDYGEAADAFQK